MTEQERLIKVRQLIAFYKDDNKNFVPVDERGREHAVAVIVYRLDLPELPLSREQERGVARLYQEGLNRIHLTLSQLAMVQLGSPPPAGKTRKPSRWWTIGQKPSGACCPE